MLKRIKLKDCAVTFSLLYYFQVFDSSSKLQPGLLVGNTGELGSFEECLKIYTATEYGPIRGQMCTLKVEPGPNLTRTILQIRNLPNSVRQHKILTQTQHTCQIIRPTIKCIPNLRINNIYTIAEFRANNKNSQIQYFMVSMSTGFLSSF